MTGSATSPFQRDVAAALDWWRGAGVDCDYSDEPVSWLAPPPEPESRAPAQTRTAPPPPPVERVEPMGGERAAWPKDLAAFRAWWLSEPSLDAGNVSGRVPSRGEVGAELLVLVEHPEAEDHDSLLSGPDGALLAGFLAAAGLHPEQVALASVLPRHTPHADWARLAQAGIGDLLAHHVALIAPKRAIAFGSNILPLLGHDPAKSPDFSLEINQEGASVPLLALRDLTALRRRPAWKAAMWRRWLDWTG